MFFFRYGLHCLLYLVLSMILRLNITLPCLTADRLCSNTYAIANRFTRLEHIIFSLKALALPLNGMVLLFVNLLLNKNNDLPEFH